MPSAAARCFHGHARRLLLLARPPDRPPACACDRAPTHRPTRVGVDHVGPSPSALNAGNRETDRSRWCGTKDRPAANRGGRACSKASLVVGGPGGRRRVTRRKVDVRPRERHSVSSARRRAFCCCCCCRRRCRRDRLPIRRTEVACFVAGRSEERQAASLRSRNYYCHGPVVVVIVADLAARLS